MSARLVCACVGEGRAWRPCLYHFSFLSAGEQARISIGLGITWKRRENHGR